MRVSFGVTTHNEGECIRKLLSQLTDFIENNDTADEIVILDDYSTDPDTTAILEEHESLSYVYLYQHALDRDFGRHKNCLNSYCTGDYIFQIDADETLAPELLERLHFLIESNASIDLFLVPRVNTVEGLTDEHIAQWGWAVNEAGWILWPDYQTRLYRNSPDIMWMGRVHERIDGHNTYAHLPANPSFAIQHHKDIRKQEAQNALYSEIAGARKTKAD